MSPSFAACGYTIFNITHIYDDVYCTSHILLTMLAYIYTMHTRIQRKRIRAKADAVIVVSDGPAAFAAMAAWRVVPNASGWDAMMVEHSRQAFCTRCQRNRMLECI